ncbi:hypothetical protein [Porphyrobacter sp. YT40]|uniref:hypothetical protein n=1 Tax=Porphyrobacter sp. YT40 TaxID=2547601 RepID=UPI0025740902|nr:hypothetical protein [Porphyrobacter sp. YT40]
MPASTAPAPAPAPTARPAARPTPAPVPPPVVQTLPADQWMDAAATPGDWTQGLIAGVPFALFGTDSRIPALGLRCLRADGTITVARRSDSPSQLSMTIRTETTSRSLVAEPVQGFPGRFLGVSLRADDPLLDAMALSKGRFAVEVDGMPPLYLPSYAEVSRVIEDCRG